jgi:hypothetical protein
MGRFILISLGVALLVGLWARAAFAEKRKQKEEPTELNKHPERLDQSLDPTDDA